LTELTFHVAIRTVATVAAPLAHTR
jgi:hypothetical protein